MVMRFCLAMKEKTTAQFKQEFLQIVDQSLLNIFLIQIGRLLQAKKFKNIWGSDNIFGFNPFFNT